MGEFGVWKKGLGAMVILSLINLSHWILLAGNINRKWISGFDSFDHRRLSKFETGRTGLDIDAQNIETIVN